jgi:hypothetical protein
VSWLNLGSGPYPAAPPWINVDHEAQANVKADVRFLPFPDDCAERVYMGHLLEHLPLVDVRTVLFEARRVLEPGGELMVVGPDVDRALALATNGDRLEDGTTVLQVLIGSRERPGMYHQWACHESRLMDMVQSVFEWAEAIPIKEVKSPWPLVSDVGWQCAVKAIR